MHDRPPSPQYSQFASESPQQSIPLRNLQRQPEQLGADGQGAGPGGGGDGAPQQQGAGAAAAAAPIGASLTGISTYWENPYTPYNEDGRASPDSFIDPAALQFALPPDVRQRAPLGGTAFSTPYYEDVPDTDSFDSDRVPLKPAAQPISGLQPPEGGQPRDSFQTVSDLGNDPVRSRGTQMLGYDLEPGFESGRRQSYGGSLTPEGRSRSRSPSTSGALSRAGSIMRAMSQRVVMISGEGEHVGQAPQERPRSSSTGGGARHHYMSDPMLAETTNPFRTSRDMPSEKTAEPEYVAEELQPPISLPRTSRSNPLKGKSLGIFPPDNPIRKHLCDVLVNPWTEPLLLVLIILQAILLVVQAAPNVFREGNERPDVWGYTRIDWAIFGLFIVFTAEILARIIVSGLVINAQEYAAADEKLGIRQKVADQYRQIFRPHRHKSVKGKQQEDFAPTFARSFTIMQGRALPSTVEDQQRLQLARRAFLRHGFNRLDFVAMVSFWISFVLGMTGVERDRHLYIFRMLSCLRILRLLALTKGNAVILRSLRKATPLLIRVSFLMGFFWLVFSIIGVQSFKSSLRRQCLWLDPDDPDNITAAYTPDESFCGGYLDNRTGERRPWLYPEIPGTLTGLQDGSNSPKGFICPRGSICVQQSNPYNGTVNFDNIANSVELVFVIMSANTFTDLMYYTMNSDYMAAALFFAAGIIIMMLWMTNLLIAVITSSFQVIREESKASAFAADENPARSRHTEEPLRRQSALRRMYNKTWWFWVAVIAFGTFVQAFRSARMSASREHFINSTEAVVTIALDIEIVIRIVADFRRFHHRISNLVDLALAVVTSIILLPPIRHSGQPYAWLTVFQLLRSYRVVLAIPMTRKLILLVLGNVSGIGNLMLFVFLITFLMAIFAAQLFRGQIPEFDDGGDNINVSFNAIFNCFLGMYQILSSENWTDILYNVTTYTTHSHTAWYGAIFLIGWFILSFFILINMFIAVIQENFDVSEDVKRLEQIRAFLQKRELGSTSSNMALSRVLALVRGKKWKDPLDYGPTAVEMLLKEAVVREFLDETIDPLHESPEESHASPQLGDRSPPRGLSAGAGGAGGGGGGGVVGPGFLSAIRARMLSIFGSRDPNPFYSNFRFDGPDTHDARQMALQAVSATSARRKAQREYLARHPTYNKSLFIFKPKNPIRRLCQRLVGPGRGKERFDGVEPNKYAWYTFSALVYAAIVAMVVLACVVTPLYQREYFTVHEFSFVNWFVWTDVAFAVVFTAEALIKVVADGFFWTPNAYFRSSWGIIDGIVLVTLWINVITLFENDGAVSRAVGAFKALRALRLLNASESARQTFHSLIIVAGWKILGAAFVSISLLIPFAIYGVNLFNGKLVSCNDGGIDQQLIGCFGEYNSTPFSSDWELLSPRVAANDYYSFDDFGSALFILYQIVSQEGWIDVSFAAQSITGRGSQPEFGASQENAVFFVIFNLMATVFVLTLFISVFMRTYTEQTGVAYLTAEQRSWLELRRLLRQVSPSKSSCRESASRWKTWCHKRATEKRGRWYLAITCVLVLHLVLLLCEYYPEPEWWTRTRDVLLFIFTLIYMGNSFVRLVGLGWSRFRRSSWDLYASVVVTGAFSTTILYLTNTVLDSYIQLHKIFLVAIVLLLIPRNDALDQLFKTAAASLSTIGSLVATWLVFFLVFAIAMTQTFSLTRFGSQETNNINLRTVPKALILLFRMSCGEGWNQIMEDYATISAPLCVESSSFTESDCGSATAARLLFIAWNIISMYIFVNLFVSLIYESFSYVYQRTSGLALLDREELRRFKEAWRTVDPAGTGYISKEAFPRLLGELSGVFEMRIYQADDSIQRILEDARAGARVPSRTPTVGGTGELDSGVDLDKLNERLGQIDVVEVRERRRRFNVFYEEVMVMSEPDRGISFESVLMTLAYYNVIRDSKSLQLEDFLRRRARLQRVEDELQRRVVVGFFDTLYWSRRFRRHLEAKRAGRLTAIPQLGVPEILIDDEEESSKRSTAGRSWNTASGSGATSTGAMISADDAQAHHRTWTGVVGDLSGLESPSAGHPLSRPRTQGSGSSSHRPQPSAFSFELVQDAGDTRASSARSSRRGSGVNREDVRGILEDSVWMDSIKRSTTIRRDEWGGQGRGWP